MEQTGRASTYSLGFVIAVLGISGLVFAVIARLAEPAAPAPQPDLSTVEIRALAQQATLRVSASTCGRVTTGSGVIVDGYLVTNAHIVAGADELKADQPIDPVVVPIIGVAPATDLAAAEQPVGVSLVLAPSGQTRQEAIVGVEVTLAGHADGGNIEIQTGTVTARVPGAAYGYASDVLLIDAPTRGGYSGGSVMDSSGALVGLLSGFDRATGLSLAIPADVVGEFLDATAALEGNVDSDCGVG